MLDKFKAHIKRHKTVYISVGTGVVVAGITMVIMRSNIARGAMGGANARGAFANTASRSFLFHSPQTINVQTVLDRGGRGHPGWPVQNLETKRIFFSQKEAAKAFDIPEKILSAHITGKFSDADGMHFYRVNLTPEGVSS